MRRRHRPHPVRFFIVVWMPLVFPALRCAAGESSPRILPISSLRTWVGQPEERVSVRGVVTRAGRECFVQDATGGALVHFRQQPRIKVGDEVEVSGSPQATPYSARLEAAEGKVLWAGVPPPPLAITVGQAARGDFDGSFVELESRLDRIETRPDRVSVLLMSNPQQNFLAILQTASGGFIAPHIELHSMIRLRGICSMDPALTQNAVPFVLLLRSAEDAEELAGPPWWTPQLLLRDFLILLSLSLLAALAYVRTRTARVRALQREREHIAHEMHDTLAQSFAGVAFQLQAVRSGLSADSDPLTNHVDVAISMVRHSHQEARSSIAAIRTRGMERTPLAEELLRSLDRMVGNGPLRVHLVQSGIPRGIPLRIANALLRIGQEAGANAVNHSGASTLTVRLIFLDEMMMLEVEDDGCGFEVESVAKQGFGLAGMTTRARNLHGDVRVITAAGKGTTISASIPLGRPPVWRRWKRA